MLRQTLPFLLAASFSLVGLACDPGNDEQPEELTPTAEQPVVIDSVELEAQLEEDPSARVVIDLTVGAGGYILDQSDAPMPFEALLWHDGSSEAPVDFLTMSAKRGIDLDEDVLVIRPYDNSEGFRQACGTFPEEQDDLFCELDEWGWVCCSERKPSE